jgi:NADPH2:quinone reductase
MAETYRAAVCTVLTGPGSIKIEDRPVLPLSPGSVRIKIHAAGLNFPDLLMTFGKYQHRPDPPYVPGMEFSGEIIETAPDVISWAIGDRVIAGGKEGAFAEQAVMPATSLTALPATFSFDEGACWRAGAQTAWHALHDKAQLAAGESALILGASGGVGMAAVMLARHIGALVIATGSTLEKRAAILAAGADHVLDPSADDFADQVKALTSGNGVDVVYDPVGGDLSIKATRAIGWGGRYLIVGFASGTIPQFPANHAMIKGYSLIGLRAGESSRRDPQLAARTSTALTNLAKQGVMRPNISHRFSLDQTADALHVLETRRVIGRAIINP